MGTSVLQQYIQNRIVEFENIPSERKDVLNKLSDFISLKNKKNEICNLIFICTHNSRRSILTQIWAQVAACYYEMADVRAFSGGTEATAIFPEILSSLEKAGLQTKKIAEKNNPLYEIKYDDSQSPIKGFSKTYNDAFNPQQDFAAIMTCSDADKNCPFIPNAITRISLPFDDPKAFDNTSQQAEKYDERCRDIAREIFYAFSNIKK